MSVWDVSRSTSWGLFGLREEMKLAQRLGCSTIVAGGKGPVGLSGNELKTAVGKFVEQMKPHLEVAEETGVTIAIENHGNNLIDSPDSLKWLAELRPSKHLGIAFAPYHLPQEADLLGQLIRDSGGLDRNVLCVATRHGMYEKTSQRTGTFADAGTRQTRLHASDCGTPRHPVYGLDRDLHAPGSSGDSHSRIDGRSHRGN